MNLKKVIFPENLNDLEKEIKKMETMTEEAASQITKELSEYGLNEMQKIYDSFGYLSFGNDPNTFYITGSSTEKKIIMEGTQAIYEEFGTGTEGEQNPYPISPKSYNLDDYNSHKIPNGTIRYAAKKDVKAAALQGFQLNEGELFWTFKNNAGNIIYTKGTPAQREGYDSMQKTLEKSKDIITKVMKGTVFNG